MKEQPKRSHFLMQDLKELRKTKSFSIIYGYENAEEYNEMKVKLETDVQVRLQISQVMILILLKSKNII